MNRISKSASQPKNRRREIRHRVHELKREQRRAYLDAATGRTRDVAARLRSLLTLSPETRRIVLWVSAAAAAVLILAGASDALATGGRIHHGVTVGGKEMEGLTAAEAGAVLRRDYAKALTIPVTISYRGRDWTADSRELDVKPDIDRTVKAALAVGRSGGLLNMARLRLVSWFWPVHVPVAAAIDARALAKVVQNIAVGVDKTPQDAWVAISGTRIEITPSVDGKKVDQRETARRLRTALLSLNTRRVTPAVRTTRVEVTEDGAVPAYRSARLLMSRPVQLRYRSRRWTMSRAAIGGHIEFYKKERGDDEGDSPKVLEARIAPTLFQRFLRQRLRGLTVPPKNADFAVHGDKVTIVPSRSGRRIDAARAYYELSGAARSKKARAVLLHMELIKPKRTSKEARAMGVKRRVSGFTTYYDSGNASRVNNIQLIAAALDKTLVAPDAEFSLNRTVGPRTADKGYKEAPQIENGELVPALGGGACQVATTLFNAIFFGGYPVTERQPHSLYISHYPAGRDAAVSWPDPDLRFRNDTKAWILIRAWASSDSLTFGFYSTDYHRKVEYRTGPFTNFTEPRTKYIADPTLYVGDKKQVDAGYPGRSIHVHRIVWQSGRKIRQDDFFSTYQPKLRIVRQGAKPKPQPEPEHKTTTTPHSSKTSSR